MAELPASDLDEVLRAAEASFRELHGERIFLTGATGFFGRWLLESLQLAVARLRLSVEAVVLSRDPSRFASVAPHLASEPWLTLVEGDVRSFATPPGRFGFMVHGAAEVSSPSASKAEALIRDTSAVGAKRAFEFAQQAGVVRSLLLSSGAVYGPRTQGAGQILEENASDSPMGPYAEGKRIAERIATQAGAVVARCFAFSGPLLPLDANFALGNFVRDGLSGGPIRVSGDGSAIRSYLYASDLAIWLWTMLTHGEKGRIYNVGSAEGVSMADLAHLIASVLGPGISVEIGNRPQSGLAPNRYVPSIARAANELGLVPTVPLEEGLRRMAAWHRSHDSEGRFSRIEGSSQVY